MSSGAKEYTLTFLLKAASDSSYQAAFSKAKQQLNEYQKQIQSNNATLRDISAYQRQEQAVQKLSDKLTEKQTKLREVQAATTAAGNATGSKTSAELKAEAAVKNVATALEKQRQKLVEQRAALQEAGVNTDNLSESQKKLAEETARVKQEQEALAEQQNAMLEEMATMDAMAAEAYMVAQAVGKLAEEWKACVDAASGFEAAMSGVQAVSGTTKEEMAEVTAVAKQLGADTIYTATEIATAMEYMGLAGWNTQEIIEGIPAVVSLTAAAGEDLSRVSDIVTDSMQALGYTTADTAHFCDVLANTVTNANTTVDLMGYTLKYVSSTAGVMGYSIEDVSTAIAAMANNGIKGSMNGVALRNILASLAAPSSEAAEALDDLGISLLTDTGQTKSLYDVVTNLRTAFSGLAEEEQLAYATTIAGKRGMTGLLSLVNTSQEEYDNLTETIENCEGAAENMAAVRMDNLAGSVEILDGAVDALKTSIGEVYLDDLSAGALELSEIVDGLGEFAQENPAVVAGLTTTIGLFGGVAVTVPAATAAIKFFNSVMAGSALANPAFWGATAAVAAIAGIGTAIYKAASEIESTEEKIQRLKGELDTVATNQQLIEEYRSLTAEMQDNTLSAEELTEVKSELASVEAALAEAYPEYLDGIEAETAAYENQLETIEKINEANADQARAEAMAAAGEASYEFALAQKAYADAAEAATIAQTNWDNALNATDTSAAISQIEEMKAAVQGDIDTGKLVVSTEGTGDYQQRLQEIANYASTVSGQEVSFGNLADVDSWLEEYTDSTYNGADAAAYWSEKWVEANAEMQAAQTTMDNTASTFRDLIDSGYATADDFTLSLSEMGITLVDIGEKVVNGTLTQAEAMERYGLTAQEISWATESYRVALEQVGETEQKIAESTAMGYRELQQYRFAAELVANELMAVDEAAMAYGLTTEDLNEFISAQEDYEKKLAAATALVEAGYMDAETAADRFGVAVGAMEVYNASEELEALEKELQELQEAYDAAYDSAYSSIMGQLSLTEALASDAERDIATVAGATQNLVDSANYIWQYYAALETLQAFGLNPDFITNFCDTSNEGMATAIDLASDLNGMSTTNAQTAVNDLNSAFEYSSSAIEMASGSYADAETNFEATSQAIQTQIDSLEDTVSSQVQSMVDSFDQSATAYTNGYNTALSYVQGIQSQIEAARIAAAQLAAAGTPGGSYYGAGGGSYTAAEYATGGFTHGPSIAGEDPHYPVEAVISFNPAYREENIAYAQQALRMLGVSNGVTATTNEGTQYLYGGLTAYGYAAMMEYSKPQAKVEPAVYQGSGGYGSVAVSFNPTIQISQTASDLKQQLDACTEQLMGMVQRAIAAQEKEKRRTSYV